MDNYQEWTDPPTVLEDADKTKLIIKHIKLYVHEGEHHTGSLKSNISSPNRTRNPGVIIHRVI